jgi:hypothetical protein
MRYYKLINNNEFVGIGTSLDMRRFQKKHGIFLVCDESEAQYMQCNGAIYRATWMLPVDSNAKEFPVLQITEIPQEEYEALYNAIRSNKQIEIEQEEPEQDATNENDGTDITIDYVKEAKVKEMKTECNKMITNGFDVELSDNQSHHFSLTVQDQLNLITSSQMVADGAETIPYHADGELCKYYTSEDMEKIIAKANAFKTYHVAYFNSLKTYIGSLRSVAKIAAITYGRSIPSKYQSEVYIALKSELGL